MISELEIKKECSKYGFKYHYVNNSCVFITSKFDEWYVEYIGGKKPLQLYHKNTRYDVTKHHKQHRFKDVPFMIKSIKQHDDHFLNCGYSRMERLFQQIRST